MVEELEKLAKKNGCSPAQLALAWIKQLSGKPGMPEIIPIPGATTVKRVEENVQVITLKQPELEEIDNILKSMVVFGDRYGGPVAELSNG